MDSRKNMTRSTTTMNLPPIHERYHNKAGNCYYVTSEKENPHLFHYYYFEQEPTTFKVDERGYLTGSLIYGSQIPVVEMIYEVSMYNYQYKETVEHVEPFQLYHELMDTLLYHNFTFTVNGTVYEKNPQPGDDENVPDLVSLLPNMSAIPDWNESGYTYYCISRDLYEWEYCYYLYLFDSKPTFFRPNESFPDHYTALNKYGNMICYRVYQFCFDSQFSHEGRWEERYAMGDQGIIYSGVDFISSLIYHNFEINVEDQKYEAYPIPNDPVIRDLIPELPDLPEQGYSDVRNFYYRHYYITQDKYNLTKYYLYLLKYEPASFGFDPEGNLVALTKYGEPIRTDPYEYTLGYGQQEWYFLRNKDPRREFLYHDYDEIRDAVVYSNITIKVGGRIYPKNLYPNYMERPAIEFNFPSIPFIDDFKFKHYYLVQDKKCLETFYLYLLEYEPVAMEMVEEEKFAFFQQYGGAIGSIVCRYTFGEQNWSYNNNGYYHYYGLYGDMEDALVYHNFAIDLNGEYYHKHELPDDGIISSQPFEFPPIPDIPGEEDKYRYYWIAQDEIRLERYNLYMLKEQPADHLINRLGAVVFVDQEGYAIKIKHCSYTMGADNWDMSWGEYDSLRASDLNHFIHFCNFDLKVEFNPSPGLADCVIEAPANPYPNDGLGIGTVRNDWTNINGKCYYYREGKQQCGNSGWQELDGDTYYLLGANNWARVENDSVTTVRPSRNRAVSAKQKGDIYAFDHEGKMYRGRVELHGDHYLFDDDGKLIRMITGTDTYTIDTSFLAVYQSPFITDANPLVTLPDLQKITVPLPKNIVTKPDRTVWIRICYSGSGVFAKNGWVELKYLKEYYPAEGYELYIAKRSDRVKDRSGGELGHISVGSTVKVVTPKVLIPDPLTPEIRSEDLIQIIYGDGFGWFVEMSLEKIPAEGSNEMTVSQNYIDFVVEYEGGNNGTKWQYAQNLGDGVITVAFGVVIKDRSGNYPLGKAKYDELMAKKSNQIPLSWTEALDLTMDYMESSYVTSVNQKATEKGWTLNQNRFDALVDMAWNCGSVALDYKACEYLATGNLNDANILSKLEKEIAETAHMEINGVNQWTKNLVERRADVIRIAKGGSDAYTRNEFTNQHWNQNAYTILSNMGLDAATINKYPIQQV